MNPLTTTQKAFSLVELLVVVSVIALLIALLLPGLESARFAARLATCASNLRQVYTGINSYAADYLAWYPTNGLRGPIRIVSYQFPSSNETHNPSSGLPTTYPALAYQELAIYYGWQARDINGLSPTNRVWQCPQAHLEKAGVVSYSLFSDLAGGISDAPYMPDDPSPAPREATEPQNMMRRLGQTWYMARPRLNGFPKLRFDILASDITMLAEHSPWGTYTNHMWRGDRNRPGPSYVPAVVTSYTARMTTNYLMTDGSVRAFGPYWPISFGSYSVMVYPGDGGIGTDRYLVPTKWGK